MFVYGLSGPLGCGALDTARAGATVAQIAPPEAPCAPLPPTRLLLPVLRAPVPPSHVPSSLSPHPPPPPLQDGLTPLHVAAYLGHTPIVDLLLATPGVDPLAIKASGAQRRPRDLPACPTPLPSAAVWQDSAGHGTEE